MDQTPAQIDISTNESNSLLNKRNHVEANEIVKKRKIEDGKKLFVPKQDFQENWTLPSTLLVNVRSGVNIGQMMRTSYIAGLHYFYFFDPDNVWEEEEVAKEIRKYSRGSVNSPYIKKVDHIHTFLKNYKGRKVATALTDKAIPLYNFQFKEDDLLLFGNEIMGLPKEIIDQSDAHIIVPMRRFHKYIKNQATDNEGPCYSVSQAFAMVTYAINAQFFQMSNSGWKYGDWSPSLKPPTPQMNTQIPKVQEDVHKKSTTIHPPTHSHTSNILPNSHIVFPHNLLSSSSNDKSPKCPSNV